MAKSTTVEASQILKAFTQDLEEMSEQDEDMDTVEKGMDSYMVSRTSPIIGTMRVAFEGEPPVVPVRRVETPQIQMKECAIPEPKISYRAGNSTDQTAKEFWRR